MILIIGATGQLGSALVAHASGERDLLTPAHGDLDIRDRNAIVAFVAEKKPAVVINCSAFHNVEVCEQMPAPAFETNALAVDALAEACAQSGAAFATISTDYVFDGFANEPYDEHAPPNPLSAYGASKLAGELLVRRHGSRHFIFRTSGVYGPSGTSNKGYTFIERAIQQGERGEAVRVVDDMTFSPSYAPHIAATIWAAIDREAFGTHHVAGGGATTWYDFAHAAFDKLGIANAIEPISSTAFASRVKRPRYSALRSVTLPALGVPAVLPWPMGLDAFLDERRKRAIVPIV